jgi:Gas vesicle synthesis protein GvpL/GvpF
MATPKTSKTAGSRGKAGSGSARKPAGTARKGGTGSARKGNGSKRETGIYVYGILPADVEMTSEVPGVGDPPGQVRVVRSGGLAALVSEVDLAGQLGSPDDLMAHEEILDATAADVPVLPLRFGAVLTSEDAVADDLLAANHDEFAAALHELEDRAQYTVKGRYVEQAILDEVLSESKRAARLRDKIRGKDADATREERIQLGEIINEAVTAKRTEDTRALGDAMEGHCVASVVREPTHELDAVHVAFLVDADQERELEQAIENLARDWQGRIKVRLLGPMAAYDFVGTAQPES